MSRDVPTHTPRRCWPTALLILAVGALVTSTALACPYSIRDSSFISSDGPTTFRLCLLTRSDAPNRDEFEDTVEIATTTWLAASNVVVEIVDVDRGVKHELQGAIPGRLLDVAATPAAVLISPRGEATQLDLPDGPLGDAVMDVALWVIDSPVRSQLAEHCTTAWCALVVVTGDDETQNKKAFAAANDAASRIHGTVTEMDKLVEYAPEVIAIPHDSADERLVLWSLGLADDDDEETATPPRVAMLVGRGELRGPVLEGAEITSEKVYESLEMLGRSCSCTTDADWLHGPVLPLEWTDEMQAAVVAELDFDPNDPTAAGAIRDVISGLDQVLGYQEFTSGYREMKTSDDEASAPESTTLVADSPDDLIDHRNGATGYRPITNSEEIESLRRVDAELSMAATSMPTDEHEAPIQGVADGAMFAESTSETLVMNDGRDDDVEQVVIWSPSRVLMSLSVIVLVLGAATAIVWGRRSH